MDRASVVFLVKNILQCQLGTPASSIGQLAIMCDWVTMLMDIVPALLQSPYQGREPCGHPPCNRANKIVPTCSHPHNGLTKRSIRAVSGRHRAVPASCHSIIPCTYESGTSSRSVSMAPRQRVPEPAEADKHGHPRTGKLSLGGDHILMGWSPALRPPLAQRASRATCSTSTSSTPPVDI